MPLISCRIILLLRAKLFRVFQILGTFLDHHASAPLPPSPSFNITIPALQSSTPGTIKLLFYTPASYPKHTSGQSRPISSKTYPLLLNFHGGGYTIGSAHDDARFFATVLKHNPECVVVSVDYRLAPTHPFPTGIEDCAAALLYLWSHAQKYYINPNLTSLSGFSAGANFCYAVPFLLHRSISHLQPLSLPPSTSSGKLVNIISFYPALDRTRTREERAASNPNFKPVPLPPWVAGLMDECYLLPLPSPETLAGPLLSPGLASDELINDTLPEDLTIITCWGDALLGEGEKFRERLTVLGKRVAGYTVPGVIHGWDKWPTYLRGDQKRDEAYEYAALKLKEVWEQE